MRSDAPCLSSPKPKRPPRTQHLSLSKKELKKRLRNRFLGSDFKACWCSGWGLSTSLKLSLSLSLLLGILIPARHPRTGSFRSAKYRRKDQTFYAFFSPTVQALIPSSRHGEGFFWFVDREHSLPFPSLPVNILHLIGDIDCVLREFFSSPAVPVIQSCSRCSSSSSVQQRSQVSAQRRCVRGGGRWEQVVVVVRAVTAHTVLWLQL